MSPPVTFTLDLEDLRTDESQPERVTAMTHLVLDLLRTRKVRGSIYVVGEVAERHPDLVRAAAADGHEIGLHSFRHVPLGTYTPELFRAEARKGRELLQELSGQSVEGFRAPMMSLVPECAWVIDELVELGFTYSSSILPGPSPLYGWDGTPQRPFRWWNGLLELPVPLVRIPGVNLPYLGGTYLRILPRSVRRFGLRRSSEHEILWTYCHPWEFDPDEEYYEFDYVGAVASRIGWLNRRGMQRRLEQVLGESVAPPLGDRARALDGVELPTVDDRDAVSGPPRSKGGRMMNGLLRSGAS